MVAGMPGIAGVTFRQCATDGDARAIAAMMCDSFFPDFELFSYEDEPGALGVTVGDVALCQDGRVHLKGGRK
jgi:hypothetical protein